jgi:predicted nucleic-acid-binding protein
MLALDTNVLVRFLVADDEVQSARAARLVSRTIRDGDHLFVSDVVLCEVVWVLRASYGFGRAEIADGCRSNAAA